MMHSHMHVLIVHMHTLTRLHTRVTLAQLRCFPLHPTGQGKSLYGGGGIDCLRGFFAHGQLYVAMSRFPTADGVTLLLPRTQCIAVKQDDGTFVQTYIIQNVVYPELLSCNNIEAPLHLEQGAVIYPPRPQLDADAENWSGELLNAVDDVHDDTVAAVVRSDNAADDDENALDIALANHDHTGLRFTHGGAGVATAAV